MFERRLKVVLLVPIVAGLIMAARLYHLQIARGDYYQQLADEALVSPRTFLPPLRGRIIDRNGYILVSDEPAHDITVHFGAIDPNIGKKEVDPKTGKLVPKPIHPRSASYIQRLANRIRRKEHHWREVATTQLTDEAVRRILDMWQRLAAAGAIDPAELDEKRAAICASVENLRKHIYRIRKKNGFDEPIEELQLREEHRFHAIIRDLSPELRTRIEVELSGLPFVRIEPSVRRVWAEGADSICHLIGALGEVTPTRIENDPFEDEASRAYRPGDRAGVSGIEFVAEDRLRGARGHEERFLDGHVKETSPPIDGRDVALTIDLDLQQRIADILRETVATTPPSTGAACVVLDVNTREILALVSVPTYERERFKRDFKTLRDDAERRPLLCRALAEEYQPGSIVKPVALLAGFRYERTDAAKFVHCTGSLFEDSPNWHCWTHWKGMAGHGNMCAEEAIQHSCNIYFYKLGQDLNARKLTKFYLDFLRGPETEWRQGTGLIEERRGIIPTQQWLRDNRKREYRAADGRNYAIGQGEMQITPLQAANMFATLATGRYQAPTILVDDERTRPELGIPGVSPEAMRIARRGLYRCVNEEGGTAFKWARMDDLEVCGKTGSAQCVARVVTWRYRFDTPKGQKTIEAPTVERARELLELPRAARPLSRKAVRRWPPNQPDKDLPPTHAWFSAFAPYRSPKIAIAVIIEHGGSGGQTAGPVGKRVFEAIMASEADYLGRGRFASAAP